MGESQARLFEPDFIRSVKVCTSDDRLTSDAGLLLVREAEHRLGSTEYLVGQSWGPIRRSRGRIRSGWSWSWPIGPIPSPAG